MTKKRKGENTFFLSNLPLNKGENVHRYAIKGGKDRDIEREEERERERRKKVFWTFFYGSVHYTSSVT